jgi:hypothetical protein
MANKHTKLPNRLPRWSRVAYTLPSKISAGGATIGTLSPVFKD